MCGIFAVYNARGNAAEECAIGLHTMQHRAHDFAGMVTSDGTHLRSTSGKGLARQVFTGNTVEMLHGKHALGHIRYSTQDDEKYGKEYGRAQPILQDNVALAHNGNLRNAEELRRELSVARPFATTMDSESLLWLYLKKQGSVQEKIEYVFSRIHGSASFVLLTRDQLIAVRDPSGNRPLWFGCKNGSWLVSSETVALDAVGVRDVYKVHASEVVSINDACMQRRKVKAPSSTPYAPCVFEEIYFSHPASRGFDGEVVDFREELGRKLAKLFQERVVLDEDIDMVVPAPDSANFHAVGVSRVLGVCSYPALTRSHYIGRTFISKTQSERRKLVNLKFSAVPRVVGKNIFLIDDSIVRLNTLPHVVDMLWEKGARSIHVGIACPPIKHPCVYGIDTPDYDDLEAPKTSIEKIKEKVGATSLTYLPLETLKDISGPNRCFACMNGKYW